MFSLFLLTKPFVAPCSGLDIKQYWSTLHAANINARRLASFDRSITHEPAFGKVDLVPLRRDLAAYLVTLAAVHDGEDLKSAADAVLGYKQVRDLPQLPLCCLQGGLVNRCDTCSSL